MSPKAVVHGKLDCTCLSYRKPLDNTSNHQRISPDNTYQFSKASLTVATRKNTSSHPDRRLSVHIVIMRMMVTKMVVISRTKPVTTTFAPWLSGELSSKGVANCGSDISNNYTRAIVGECRIGAQAEDRKLNRLGVQAYPQTEVVTCPCRAANHAHPVMESISCGRRISELQENVIQPSDSYTESRYVHPLPSQTR